MCPLVDGGKQIITKYFEADWNDSLWSTSDSWILGLDELPLPDGLLIHNVSHLSI